MMRRRDFLKLAPLAALPAPAFQSMPSKMKITGVRLVHTRPKRPLPAYKAAPGSWSTGGVEVANPMSIYPKYKAMRSLFMPDPGKLEGFTVEISTDKGVKGLGTGGIAGGQIVEQHLTKLLVNEDPFNVERLWDIMWRSTMYYGRTGPVFTPSAAWTWRCGTWPAMRWACPSTSCSAARPGRASCPTARATTSSSISNSGTRS